LISSPSTLKITSRYGILERLKATLRNEQIYRLDQRRIVGVCLGAISRASIPASVVR
jgi:hypothetical protein